MMNTITKPTERRDVPSKAYDSEYATQIRKEMEYLKSLGIHPTYVKYLSEYRIPTYKYKKTPELFRAVADFYEQRQNEKTFNNLAAMIRASSALPELC